MISWTNRFNIIIASMSTLDEQLLLKAYRDGKLEEAKRLVENGAVHAKNNEDWTPLHFASGRKGRTETVSFLVSKGADVHAKDIHDWTPLHIACHHGSKETVIFLVSKRVDVHAKIIDDWTPLHLACIHGSKETVCLLVDKGADLKAKTKRGSTPLHEACHKGNFDAAFVLLDHGADFSIKNNDGKTAQDVAKTTDFLKLIRDSREKLKMETAAFQEEEMKSEKAFSSDQVIKLVRESEQHKFEMTALQDKMKAEMIALTVQDHKLVLENEQYKSKLAAMRNTRKKPDRQMSVLAFGIGLFLPLLYFALSPMKENEAKQQDVSVECFILLFFLSPFIWLLLEAKKATHSNMGHAVLSVCELQDLEVGETQELISRTEEAKD
jgi:ankyrin repeat protein